MRNNNVTGIVFANVNDDLLPELTGNRSMAAVPFGSRYRLIDFSLSNLVNAGISEVGVITRENYQSLMDHIGSAKSWDLDRKDGGLHILPPYVRAGAAVYKGQIDALFGIRSFIRRATGRYVVMCYGNTVMNIDIADMLSSHIQSGADITLAYAHGRLPANHSDSIALNLCGDRITSVKFFEDGVECCDHTIGVTIIERELLIKLVEDAAAESKSDFSRDIIAKNLEKLNIRGYKFSGFCAVMDGPKSYVEANMRLLEHGVREDLFNRSRPVYTRVKDAMPTRYGISSSVVNSLVAEGCVIEGTVKNSVLFRSVHVGKGARIENCIIMQGSVIGEGANLCDVTLDKDVTVGAGSRLCGAPQYYIFVKKGEKI